LNIDEIKEWVSEYQVVERAVKGFWKNVENYSVDEPGEFAETFGEFDKEQLTVGISKISLNLGNWPECSYNTVSTRIPIVYKEKTLGHYELYFTLSGEVEDDCFVIY
jgi:hypothetical protein